MSKPFSFEKQHKDDQRGFDNRQKALEALQETCTTKRICAACGASAGLYLAAMAADTIEYSREDFLRLAAKVWDDLEGQQKSAPIN